MFLVEFYSRTEAMHDARPVKAQTEEQARAAFHERYVIGAGWFDSVAITNITRKQ